MGNGSVSSFGKILAPPMQLPWRSVISEFQVGIRVLRPRESEGGLKTRA